MPKSQFFSVANMSFNAFCKNKILTKISQFTVPYTRVRKINPLTGLHDLNYMDLVATKSVFGVPEKMRLKPACSATGTS